MYKLLILLLSLTLFSCATPYQAKGFKGGYSETQLDENVFIVNFYGNAITSREQVNDYLLLRSAELTLEKGFKYFKVLNEKQYSENSTHSVPVTTTTNIDPNNGQVSTNVSGGETYTISKPVSSNTITCYKDEPEGFSFKASYLVKSLSEKYKAK
jgi:hypothetical protein